MSGGVTRRRLLVGGGAGIGLLAGWALWPRSYPPNLVAAPGEAVFGPYLKIATDGRVIVAVPQAETGQGVSTTFPQIVADELGADWRTVAVETAPIHPLYANRLFAAELAQLAGHASPELAATFATRSALMVTAGATSVRMFETPLRLAAAAARARLCQAAARQWDVAPEECDTRAGFVVHGDKQLRFAELADAAAAETAPAQPALRMTAGNRLAGVSVPRLDAPAKLDGSANFTADVRLPGMLFAAIRQGPVGGGRLVGFDAAAADRVQGVIAVVDTPDWLAAVATNWWAANRALDAMRPRFERGSGLGDAMIAAALDRAFQQDGDRIVARGDLAAAFAGATVQAADYRVAAAATAALEPVAATAAWEDGRIALWLPTLAPESARRAVAAALDLSPDRVIVHPMPVGGGSGRGLDSRAAVQAATLAARLKRPIQLCWSRIEDLVRDRFRPPARARLTAKLAGGRIEAWQAKIAAPAYGRAVAADLLPGRPVLHLLGAGAADGFAVAGAEPAYAIPHLAVDHHPADLDLPIGYARGAAHGYTAFFTESFVDELAHSAGADPFTFRMAMLSGAPRLARCLSAAAALGGWQGGTAGTGQGLACHSAFGSHIAVVAEARTENGRIKVDRLAAAVDAGRLIHPDIVRQQIEGGLIVGLAAALGSAPGLEAGLPRARRLGDLGLPRLADAPDISVELVASDEDPGGVSELAVPAVAPALANALFAATGRRYRQLPVELGAA